MYEILQIKYEALKLHASMFVSLLRKPLTPYHTLNNSVLRHGTLMFRERITTFRCSVLPNGWFIKIILSGSDNLLFDSNIQATTLVTDKSFVECSVSYFWVLY